MAEVKQFVFFDFEMLCSNRGMPFEDMEAIRLGAVKYDVESEKVTYFDQFIKPTQVKPLSRFCKKLTGIEDSDLINAANFKDVFADFLSFVGGVKKARFFSWSKSDLTRLQLDATKHAISQTTITKIEKRYVDFQAILTKRVSKNNLSVENALELYGLDFIGQKHNPMFDAYNTLRIFLSFQAEPLKSDLIMLNQFVFDEELTNFQKVNSLLTASLKNDLTQITKDLKDVYKFKHAQKVVKTVKRTVKKYENILYNRSGIFSQEVIEKVKLLVEFYQELRETVKEHVEHSSRVIILDDHLIRPIRQIAI